MALLLVCATALAIVAKALPRARALRASWPREADTWLLPSAGALRVLSFGHLQMAADVVAARTNVYFGAELSSRGEQAMLERSLDTAVALDPSFHRLYLRGAAMLVYGGRGLTIDGLLAANRLLAKGGGQFPDDWELPFQRGFNSLFELPKLARADDPRVADWRQEGVEALRQATLLDGAPPWLANLAARLLTKDGGEELAIRHLERTFEVTDNPRTRAEVTRKLAQLKARRSAQQLADDADGFAAAIAAAYPYAPEAFSVVLGPRSTPGIDLDVLLRRRTSTVSNPDSARPARSPVLPGATPDSTPR